MGPPASLHSLLVGTGDSRHGLQRVPFDPATGAFGTVQPQLERPDLTWVTSPAAPAGTRCYAVSEGPGRVLALARDPHTGALHVLNEEPAAGPAPCHAVLDRTGRTLIVTHFNGGSVAAYPILPDGRLGPRRASFEHHGSGPRSDRQERPHPHSTTLAADHRTAYVCDLGLDQVLVYRLGHEPGELLAPALAPGRTPAGAGPRHAKLSADGRFLYVVNELGGSVTTFAVDPQTGALTAGVTVSALQPGFAGANDSAEIHLHPAAGEPFVYVSNRGPDTIARLARDPHSGALTWQGETPCGGRHPRHFALSPDGRWLVVANRHSNALRSFAIDPVSGDLQATGHGAALAEPCCIRFEV